MNFDPSQEEKEFDEHVKKVIHDRIRLEFGKWKADDTTPPRMWEILGEEGLLGFRLEDDPEGGEPLVKPIPWIQNIHYYKNMAQFSGGVAIASFASTQLGLQGIHFYGSDDHKKNILVPGIQGKKTFAFANTEGVAGSDASAIATRAEDMGDHYVVNGSKAYITNADLADHILFTAVTNPEEEKQHRRISMFVIHRDTPGMTTSVFNKIGWKPSHLCAIQFNDVEIPKEDLLGEPKRGFYQTMDIFNNSRIGIAALALGTSLGAFKAAYKHAKTRMAFGRTLFEHESKKHEFGEMISRLHAGWLLVQKAAYLRDQGKEFRWNASMAKFFCTEEGLAISQWATETFGARGVIGSLSVSQYPLDAKLATLGEGAPEVQKKIISAHIDELLEDF